MIIKKRCPHCNKQIDVKSELDIGSAKLITFFCNHTIVEQKVQAVTEERISLLESISKFRPFAFQKTGIKFIIDSNVRCLIADEMGLGKTIQALCALALNREDLLPAIFVCKAIAQTNWLKETIDWLQMLAQLVSGSKATCFEQFKIHIVSFDLLSRLEEAENQSWQKIVRRAKTIVIDESHLIKSHTTKRTVALKKICFPAPEESVTEQSIRSQNGQNGQLSKIDTTVYEKHIIALSGTPIKNNATEYFSILNILHPEIFHNFDAFNRNYVDQYFNTETRTWKFGGLKDTEDFKKRTKDFIIRRTMDEVLPDLPKVFRQFKYTDLSDKVQAIYDKEWQDFADFWDANESNKDFDFYNNILAKMAKLRHLTGLAKIEYCLDNLMEFLGSTDRKICVFVHHQDVGQILKDRVDAILKELNLAPAMTLTAKDTKDAQNIAENFKNSESRVLIASTLAAGESINLQFMSDVIMLERQWNPANEEQAGSGRFRRIGQTRPVVNSFIVAVGTIDEYFAELVERKRQMFQEAMSGEKSDVKWDQQSIIMELGEILARKGREKWSLAKQ